MGNLGASSPVDQKCGGNGCMTCPHLFNSNDIIIVNGERVHLDFKLTCRDNNIIYVCQCILCNKIIVKLKEDTYFGQSVTPMNFRMSNHRNKFVADDPFHYEKSALAMHCHEKHGEQLDMKYFKLGIIKKVRPVELNRQENFYINKFKTNIWGINRYEVVT